MRSGRGIGRSPGTVNVKLSRPAELPIALAESVTVFVPIAVTVVLSGSKPWTSVRIDPEPTAYAGDAPATSCAGRFVTPVMTFEPAVRVPANGGSPSRELTGLPTLYSILFAVQFRMFSCEPKMNCLSVDSESSRSLSVSRLSFSSGVWIGSPDWYELILRSAPWMRFSAVVVPMVMKMPLP